VPVVLQRWALADITGLSAEAERARDSLITYIERLGKVARRVDARRELARA
jgi:hypothetical protein